MAKVAIIVLKPKKDRTEELIALLKQSNATMQRLGVVSSKEHIVCTSEEGAVIHIFEWANENSQEAAAEHSEIRDLWMEAERLCEFLKPSAVKEFNEVFPSFTIIK